MRAMLSPVARSVEVDRCARDLPGIEAPKFIEADSRSAAGQATSPLLRRLLASCFCRRSSAWVGGDRCLFRDLAFLLRPDERPHSVEFVMGKKLYVGNLSYSVTDSELEQMFAAHGTVESAQ